MGGPRAIRGALLAVLLGGSMACSGATADKAGPTATVGTEPPATTTTNPYAVPAVIDAAYVNRVLAGLDAIRGDVARLVLQTQTIPREAYDRLKAMYADPDFLQNSIDSYQLEIRQGLRGYRKDPGNILTQVRELITARPNCIFARVERDRSAVAANPPPNTFVWVGLRPLDPLRDPMGYNTTGWAYVYDGFPPDRSRPEDPCRVS
ncbi:MAG: hypothetical protein M3203_06105 [Actinomycetota bacterium]|nr:hypothetical protein [Actinomycetota bacterium]